MPDWRGVAVMQIQATPLPLARPSQLWKERQKSLGLLEPTPG